MGYADATFVNNDDTAPIPVKVKSLDATIVIPLPTGAAKDATLTGGTLKALPIEASGANAGDDARQYAERAQLAQLDLNRMTLASRGCERIGLLSERGGR